MKGVNPGGAMTYDTRVPGRVADGEGRGPGTAAREGAKSLTRDRLS